MIKIATKAEKKAINKYNKKVYKTITFRLRKDTESDIIKFIDEQPNKNEFIKSCIVEKMKK